MNAWASTSMPSLWNTETNALRIGRLVVTFRLLLRKRGIDHAWSMGGFVFFAFVIRGIRGFP